MVRREKRGSRSSRDRILAVRSQYVPGVSMMPLAGTTPDNAGWAGTGRDRSCRCHWPWTPISLPHPPSSTLTQPLRPHQKLRDRYIPGRASAQWFRRVAPRKFCELAPRQVLQPGTEVERYTPTTPKHGRARAGRQHGCLAAFSQARLKLSSASVLKFTRPTCERTCPVAPC